MITAGGSGIGWAIAKAFCDTGAKVHVCDVDERGLQHIAKNNPQVIGTHLDVSNEAAVNRWSTRHWTT